MTASGSGAWPGRNGASTASSRDADALRERLGPQLSRPARTRSRNSGRRPKAPPSWTSAAGTMNTATPDDDGEERRVDDQDRQAPADTGPAPDRAHHRLQRRPEQDGEEDEQEHVARRAASQASSTTRPTPTASPAPRAAQLAVSVRIQPPSAA